MKRRDFGKALVGGTVGVGLSTLIPATRLAVGQHVPGYGPLKPVTPKKNLKMHVGSDYHVIQGPAIFSKENLEYNVRFGVKSISPILTRKRIAESPVPAAVVAAISSQLRAQWRVGLSISTCSGE